MLARRSVLSVVCAAAVILAPLFWLAPAFLHREALSFRDQGDFFYPLKLYTMDRIRAGEIPLWNPLSGTGEPWLANLQSGVFYPPSFLFLLPSPALAGALFLLFHFGLGAWGTWHFLKEEGVSDLGALFGAAIFAGSGFAASFSAYWNHFGAWAYLPAIASLARGGLRSRRSRLGLAVLLGLQAMAGSPELSAATFFVAMLLAWEAQPERGGWADPPPTRRLLRCSGAAALGLALAGWALLPMGELVLRSDRRIPLPAPEREVSAVGVEAVSSLLTQGDGAGKNYYLSSLYLGPLALLAALAALAERERRRLTLLLALIAAAGVVIAMAPPPGSWLRALPPLDRLRYPAKGLALTFFALSLLAGLGADALRFVRIERYRLLLGLVSLAGIVSALFSNQLPVLRLAVGAGLLAFTLLAFGVGRGTPAGALPQGIAALALVASLLEASRGILRFAPESEIRRQPQSIAFLAGLAGRVLTPPVSELAPWVVRDTLFDAKTLRRQRESLIGYTNLLQGVRTVRTAAPLPTAAAQQIAKSIDAAQNFQGVAGAASARVLWMPFQPTDLGSRKVGEFFRAPLNPYRPRLSFVAGYRVEPDAQRAWGRVSRGEIDWAKEVFLDREPRPAPVAAGRRGFVIARIAEDRPERVVVEVASDAAGLLVLTDLHYPGWTAQADGRAAELLRADGFFRAVAVPAGSHRVVFRYRPVSFYVGAALSLGALLTILLGLYRGEPSWRR